MVPIVSTLHSLKIDMKLLSKVKQALTEYHNTNKTISRFIKLMMIMISLNSHSRQKEGVQGETEEVEGDRRRGDQRGISLAS